MPRNPIATDPETRKLLRQKIESTFGKSVTRSFQCDLLSSHIKKATGEYLSAQSLRRFFGLLRADFNPAISTLNILSRYCGYADFDDFSGQLRTPAFTPANSKEEVQLYLDFFKLKLQKEEDINLHNACRIIATRILKNAALFEELAKPLAQSPMAQVFFYERFPFIDGLCSGYARGIKLYLQHKKEDEAQIFGVALLILSAFLSKNQAQLQACFKQLQSFRQQNDWHPFVTARYIGSHLLHYHVQNDIVEKERWLAIAKTNGQQLSRPSKIRFWHFPYYQFLLCDYLNLIKEYPLSAHLMSAVSEQNRKDMLVEEGYYEALMIIDGISLNGLKKTRSAEKKWQAVDFGKLGITFRKYYALQYALALLPSIAFSKRKKRQQLQNEIQRLIEETGFTYFRESADI